MKTNVIKAPKGTAELFNRLLKDKADTNKEVREKFNRGELKTGRVWYG